jgi:fumarate hydratase class II
MSMTMRIEKDSMGELQVPKNALYGAQTQRAINNFPISGLTMPRAFIQALGFIKASAAEVNQRLGLLDPTFAQAIITAALQVAEGQHDAHFPIDVFQTGSGTSSNMNCNEVIAHVASDLAGKKVHPNDHVNCSQSSNDVIPTAIHVAACLMVQNKLLPALAHCATLTRKKAATLQHVAKTGRTHLMDAMPVTLGQELNAFATQIENGKARVESALQRICYLAQGGTAVGTGINADPRFGQAFADVISKKTGFTFKTSPNYFESLATQDAANELSGQLKTVAGSFMKIANDLRWMNSGPLAGISEIALPALQPGSSIMPGKVNPVIPEAVCMVCAQVMGNDVTISVAASHGNFQLNVMLPVVAYNLLQSIELLSNAATLLADKAIEGFTVNEANIEARLSRNPILVTALNAVIGYEKGAAIAKKAYAENRPLIEVALEETQLSKTELEKLLDPHALTKGGIPG